MGFGIAAYRSQEARDIWGRKWRAVMESVLPSATAMEVGDATRPATLICDAKVVTCHESGRTLAIEHGGLPGTRSGSAPDISAEQVLRKWYPDASASLATLDGPFALALYDAPHGALSLARDRFGTRPVYYVDLPDVIFAATDVAALLELLPDRSIDRSALLLSIRFRFNVMQQHLFSSIRKVQAASHVKLGRFGEENISAYWELSFDPEPDGTLDEWAGYTRDGFRKFFEAERLQDETVGILLSGGVDSAVIAAAAKESCRNVIAYVAKFADSSEEASRAQAVAEHLGIRCNVIEFQEDQIRDDLQAIVKGLGEPPLHANNLVLLQLYKRAAQDVSIVLQGDAAEMLFGLADSMRVPQFARKRRVAEVLVPRKIRKSAANHLTRWDSSLCWRTARVLERDVRQFALSLDEIRYSSAVRRVAEPAWTDAGIDFPYAELLDSYSHFDDGLQAYQARTFLQASTDRHYRLAQMAGVESMGPFLSGPLVAVASKLPRSLRFTDTARPVVKKLCDQIAHPEVSRWKKLGFPVPWATWLEGPLAGAAGNPAEHQFLEDERVLPPGFLAAAWQANDKEGKWLASSLRMLLDY